MWIFTSERRYRLPERRRSTQRDEIVMQFVWFQRDGWRYIPAIHFDEHMHYPIKREILGENGRRGIMEHGACMVPQTWSMHSCGLPQIPIELDHMDM